MGMPRSESQEPGSGDRLFRILECWGGDCHSRAPTQVRLKFLADFSNWKSTSRILYRFAENERIGQVESANVNDHSTRSDPTPTITATLKRFISSNPH
jgi:hypothetical protein